MSSTWVQLPPPYTLPLISADRVLEIDELAPTTVSTTPAFTINTGSLYCAGQYYYCDTPAQNAYISLNIDANIYSNTTRIKVVYYNGSGYSSSLSGGGNSITFRIGLLQSNSSYYAILFLEGNPPNSKKVLYQFQFLNNNSVLASFVCEVSSYGTYGYTSMKYTATDNNGSTIDSMNISSLGVGNINGSTNFNVFYPTYAYVTDDTYRLRSSSAEGSDDINTSTPMYQKNNGLWYFSTNGRYTGPATGATGHGAWTPYSQGTGSFDVSLEYDGYDTMTVYYTQYNNTTTPTYVTLASSIQAGTNLTTPAQSSAGSVPGHKFVGWKYNDVSYSSNTSFQTVPFRNVVLSDWIPLKFKVFHNNAWVSTGVFIAHNGQWVPPDAIKVYKNGDWVDL